MQVPSSPLLSLLAHCTNLHQLQKIHGQMITTGLVTCNDSSLVQLLPFFNLNPTFRLTYALSIFAQIQTLGTFAWNTIIRAHTLWSTPLSAIRVYVAMRRDGMTSDSHTYPFVLKACARLCMLELGRTLHSEIVKLGFDTDIFVHNTLIHMYCNSRSMDCAHQLFVKIPQRDVVSFNAMIAGFVISGEMDLAFQIFDEMVERDVASWSTVLLGYARANRCKEALDLYECMLASGIKPNNVALVIALLACAQLGSLDQVRSIHDYIKKNGIHYSIYISAGLVDMYAKCGCIELARELFDKIPERNLFTWNAIIVGLAMHGHAKLSLEYFLRMQTAKVQPDGVAFVGVLVACSHAGFIKMGRRFFAEMESVYNVGLELKHYGCMADLLGRAGLIEEVMDMIEQMPMKPDDFVWGGLLGGCRIHGNVEVAETAVRHLLELDSEDSGIYSIMANIYAAAGKWEDIIRMRRMMNVRRVKKMAGCSLIQVNGISHEFVAGDKSHPMSDEIYNVLDGFCKQFDIWRAGAVLDDILLF